MAAMKTTFSLNLVDTIIRLSIMIEMLINRIITWKPKYNNKNNDFISKMTVFYLYAYAVAQVYGGKVCFEPRTI